MTAKKLSIFVILLMAVLLSACHVADLPTRTQKVPLLGSVQLKLPKIPAKPLTADQVQATTTAIIGRGIPEMKAEAVFAANTLDVQYFLQGSTPAALQDFAHPDLACNWLGVAGQAFDKAGNPVANLVVNVGGVLNGAPVSLRQVTGSTTTYGPYSYEIKLADKAVASTTPLWVQLSDQNNNPVSPRFYFQTTNDCAKNLIVVNFNQVDQIRALNFPFVTNN